MTLSKFIKQLQKFEKKGHGEKDVVYAADSEGNHFGEIDEDYIRVGQYDGNSQFSSEDEYGDELEKDDCNAVCIN